ncbi:hypothetical protein EV214_102119 [Marinisporobacter balticus]|uniref:Uncharacterized protein n=1 Tax=Marinisporobacter balticus TaxID=2018667 RepID=A0A4R2KXR4_9FIRM|nr:hypothetical protein EV214_102119 [Marinisporobacter balticus]
MSKNENELRKNNKYFKTTEKSYGRIETRECYICEDIDC